MKIIVDFKDFEEGSKEAGIILTWIAEIIADKNCANRSPFRYADSVTIFKEE